MSNIPMPHLPMTAVAYPAVLRICATVTVAAGSGSWPSTGTSQLPRTGECPVCSPVMSEARDGAQTVVPQNACV